MKRTLANIGLVTAIIVSATLAHAQQGGEKTATAASVERCAAQINDRLAQQERLFMQNLFGRKRSADMPLNSTLYDEDGSPWIKTETNRWVRADGIAQGGTRTNADMDAKREWDGQNNSENDPMPILSERRSSLEGIFERKQSLTSQLIPDLLQSVRALQCRTALVCEAAQQSFQRGANAQDALTIETPGCLSMKMPTLDGCAFGNNEKVDVKKNLVIGYDTTVITQCPSLATDVMERNAALLKIAVSYDAAYRTLLQFSGSLDQFLWSMRGSVLMPIEQTIPLLENLSRLPCFTAQCNG
jgi:hypothetical protein